MAPSFVSLNGIRFHYLTWKQGMGGRPVILLHGLASNARIWDLVAPHLLQVGWSRLHLISVVMALAMGRMVITVLSRSRVIWLPSLSYFSLRNPC